MMRAALWQRPWLRRLLTGAIILLVVIAFLFLAATLSAAEFQRGVGLGQLMDMILAALQEGNAVEPQAIPFPVDFWAVVGAIIWGAMILALLFLLRSSDGRRRVRSVLISTLIRGSILLAFSVFVISSVVDNGELELIESTAVATAVSAEVSALADQENEVNVTVPDPPPLRPFLFLYVLFVFGLIVYIAREWWISRRMGTGVEPAVDAVRDRALLALKALEGQQTSLADIIRQCYREMTQTVRDQQGVRRRRHTTAREFEQILTGIGLPSEPVQRLTRLFERVRYGHAAVGEVEKQEAIDSLEAIVAACDRLAKEQEARRISYISGGQPSET